MLDNKFYFIEEKIHFFWHFIHELQHLKQAQTYGVQSTRVNNFLLRCFKDKDQLFFPGEYDAEKTAKKKIIDKFQKDEFSKYLEFRIKKNQGNKSYFEKIDINDDFDVRTKTLELIKSEKVLLKNKLTEYHKQKKFLSIDIDTICKAEDIN